MNKNIIMVVNPVSGDIDKTEFIEAVMDFSENENLNLVIFTTSGDEDMVKLSALYGIYKPQRILIVGGDGTIKMVAEAIGKEDVIFGIFPAGSSNGLAVDLDLLLTIEENLNVAFQNKFIEIDVITINDKVSIHLSDLGINAELIKNYEKSAVRGKLGYLFQTFTTLMDKSGPFTATILVNDQTIVCEASMIVIANSKKYGTGVVINPNGLMNDGKFELILLKNLDLMVFGQIISGNFLLGSDDIEMISCDKAVIKTNCPVNFQMDGEYCGLETEFHIKILHKQIKVAIP